MEHHTIYNDFMLFFKKSDIFLSVEGVLSRLTMIYFAKTIIFFNF